MTQDHAEFLAFCKTVIHLESTEDIALACWVESRNRALEDCAELAEMHDACDTAYIAEAIRSLK